MRIKSDEGGITLDQEGYIAKILIPDKTKFKRERNLTEKEERRESDGF